VERAPASRAAVNGCRMSIRSEHPISPGARRGSLEPQQAAEVRRPKEMLRLQAGGEALASMKKSSAGEPGDHVPARSWSLTKRRAGADPFRSSRIERHLHGCEELPPRSPHARAARRVQESSEPIAERRAARRSWRSGRWRPPLCRHPGDSDRAGTLHAAGPRARAGAAADGHVRSAAPGGAESGSAGGAPCSLKSCCRSGRPREPIAPYRTRGRLPRSAPKRRFRPNGA